MDRTHKNAFAALLLALALAAGPAAAELLSPDAAIETSTALVAVPSTVGTSVSARSCDSCPYVTISLAATTRFFLGRQELSAGEYQSAVADGRPRGLTITYNRQTREITRVVLRAGSAPAPRR